MNNIKNKILMILSILPLIITFATVKFMPDKIPMHYDINGNIDRYGSKYENFLFPVIIIILTLFWMLFIRYYRNKQVKETDEKVIAEAKNNEKVIYIVAFGMSIMFSIMHYTSMISSVIEAKNELTSEFISTNTVVNIALGIFLIVLGNYIPKSKLNNTTGIRTKWSMNNDKVWADSNRMGGIVLIIDGILLIIQSFIFSGFLSIVIMLSIIIISTILLTIYSYISYKRNIKNVNK